MKTREIYMYVLGAIVVIGFFAVIVFKLLKNQDVQLEVGALIGSFATIVGYFFGSSKGSSDKTELLANSTPVK